MRQRFRHYSATLGPIHIDIRTDDAHGDTWGTNLDCHTDRVCLGVWYAWAQLGGWHVEISGPSGAVA